MKIKRVKQTFQVGQRRGNAPRGLHEGALVPATHPLVEQVPDMFEDVEDFVAREYPDAVERATAEPGQRRVLSRTPGKGKADSPKAPVPKAPEPKTDPKTNPQIGGHGPDA